MSCPRGTKAPLIGSIIVFPIACIFGTVGWADEACRTRILQTEDRKLLIELGANQTLYARATLARELVLPNLLAADIENIETPDSTKPDQMKGEIKVHHAQNLARDDLPLSLTASTELATPLTAQLVRNGQEIVLQEGTQIETDLPKLGRYLGKIAAGTVVMSRASAAPGTTEWYLRQGTAIAIEIPRQIRLKVTVPENTFVGLPDEPVSSGMGLRFEPARAPIGGRVMVTLEKPGFDFSEAEFIVCIRSKNQAESWRWSKDVAVVDAKPGSAQLAARIPELGTRELRLEPAKLRVIAERQDGFAYATRDYAVSKRKTAVIWAALGLLAAYSLPWLLSAGKIPWWPPINLVRGKAGRASLSLFQIWLWSLLVLASSVYVLTLTGELIPITGSILVLLGISGTSSVVAKIAAVRQADKVRQESGSEETVSATRREPRWADLISTDDLFDLYKFQMLIFTGVAAAFVAMRIASSFEFPVLPAGLVTLLGISNGVYLAGKAASSTTSEALETKLRELEAAKADIAKIDLELPAAEAAVAEAQKNLESLLDEQGSLQQRLEFAPEDEKEVLEQELEQLAKATGLAKGELDRLSTDAAALKEKKEATVATVLKLQQECEQLKKKVE